MSSLDHPGCTCEPDSSNTQNRHEQYVPNMFVSHFTHTPCNGSPVARSRRQRWMWQIQTHFPPRQSSTRQGSLSRLLNDVVVNVHLLCGEVSTAGWCPISISPPSARKGLEGTTATARLHRRDYVGIRAFGLRKKCRQAASAACRRVSIGSSLAVRSTNSVSPGAPSSPAKIRILSPRDRKEMLRCIRRPPVCVF
jgi:hypothetical protein